MKKLIAFAALLVVAASFCFADFKVKISDELDCVVHNHEVFTSYLSTENGIPYVVTWTVTDAEVLAENVKRKDAFKKCGCSLDKSYRELDGKDVTVDICAPVMTRTTQKKSRRQLF